MLSYFVVLNERDYFTEKMSIRQGGIHEKKRGDQPLRRFCYEMLRYA
jgi:hypothetical protein